MLNFVKKKKKHPKTTVLINMVYTALERVVQFSESLLKTYFTSFINSAVSILVAVHVNAAEDNSQVCHLFLINVSYIC